MPVTTRGPIDSFMDGTAPRGYPVPSNLPYWNQDTLDDYLRAWAAQPKELRRRYRAMPPDYVRTPQGIFNRRTAEHVTFPDPEPDAKEIDQRTELRIKKTRF